MIGWPASLSGQQRTPIDETGEGPSLNDILTATSPILSQPTKTYKDIVQLEGRDWLRASSHLAFCQ